MVDAFNGISKYTIILSFDESVPRASRLRALELQSKYQFSFRHILGFKLSKYFVDNKNSCNNIGTSIYFLTMPYIISFKNQWK